MKFTIMALALILSTSSFAASIVGSTALLVATPSVSTSATSAIPQKTQAAMILNDAQEYIQSGKASVFLSQKMKEAQSENTDLSEDDALEVLVTEAQAVLN